MTTELAEWMERHHAKVSFEAKSGVFHVKVEIENPKAILEAEGPLPTQAVLRALDAAYEATGDWT